MKAYKLIIMAVACCVLSACNEDETTVSKSVFGDNTIVSTPTSSGSFTRTEYSTDLWGNSTTTVSRGHSNATQQQDILKIAGLVIMWTIDQISKN